MSNLGSVLSCSRGCGLMGHWRPHGEWGVACCVVAGCSSWLGVLLRSEVGGLCSSGGGVVISLLVMVCFAVHFIWSRWLCEYSR